MGATPRGQPWTPALTLPHVRDGLSVLWMAVLCTFRRPSMGRSVHHEFMRNKLLDLTTIVPATACYQRNDVETYSRYKTLKPNMSLCRLAAISCGGCAHPGDCSHSDTTNSRDESGRQDGGKIAARKEPTLCRSDRTGGDAAGYLRASPQPSSSRARRTAVV